jgi:hypothetical protein
MIRHLLKLLLVLAAIVLPSRKAEAAVYFAADMYHNTGRVANDCRYSSNTLRTCWRASQAEGHRLAHMVFGPYTTNTPVGDNIAEFTLGFPTGSGTMVVLDVYDPIHNRVLAEKAVKYSDFTAGTSNKVKLGFFNDSASNVLEFRVGWLGMGTVEVFHVDVVGSPDVIGTYTMAQMYHQRGRASGADWSVSNAMDTAGYISFGPYQRFPYVHKLTALFKLMVDNNVLDNSDVVRIEVRSYDTGAVLATRTITRKEFSAPNVYNYFPLQFYQDGPYGQVGTQLEFRSYWYARGNMWQSTVTVHDWGIGQDPLF